MLLKSSEKNQQFAKQRKTLFFVELDSMWTCFGDSIKASVAFINSNYAGCSLVLLLSFVRLQWEIQKTLFLNVLNRYRAELLLLFSTSYIGCLSNFFRK